MRNSKKINDKSRGKEQTRTGKIIGVEGKKRLKREKVKIRWRGNKKEKQLRLKKSEGEVKGKKGNGRRQDEKEGKKIKMEERGH